MERLYLQLFMNGALCSCQLFESCLQDALNYRMDVIHVTLGSCTWGGLELKISTNLNYC